jgi:hypothetical protein
LTGRGFQVIRSSPIPPSRRTDTAKTSRFPGGGGRRKQETPPIRIYIIGNDGITLRREPPAAVNEGEIVVASNEELRAARLSGKRLRPPHGPPRASLHKWISESRESNKRPSSDQKSCRG